MANNIFRLSVLGLLLLVGISPLFAQVHGDQERHYRNKTHLTYSRAHGYQIEYYSPEGTTHLWYPGNRRVVHGRWRVDHDRGRICFSYGRKSYNPVTGRRGNGWQCQYLDEKSSPLATGRGDLFNLEFARRVPFALAKHDADALPGPFAGIGPKRQRIGDEWDRRGENDDYSDNYNSLHDSERSKSRAKGAVANITIWQYIKESGGAARYVGPERLKLGGRRNSCGRHPTVLDPEFNTWAGAYTNPGFIIVNPIYMRKESSAVQLFIYARMCGHQIRGFDADRADAFAIRGGVRQGWLKNKEMKKICKFISRLPGDSQNPNGIIRCKRMKRVYADIVERY